MAVSGFGFLLQRQAAAWVDGAGGGPDTPPAFVHETVMADEVAEWLQPGPGRVFLDVTLGGGGHSERLLKAGADVVGMDRDGAAIEAATRRLVGYGARFRVLRANFGGLGPGGFSEWAASLSGSGGLGAWPERFDGIVADLGISSPQIDRADRGFSFMRDGDLDMRMDQQDGPTAADLVNGADEAALAGWIRTYGEDPNARRIARAIVAARKRSPLRRTVELAALIEKASPRRGGGNHPATRTFQALRMVVNGEIEALKRLLAATPWLLNPGGRLAVISFHSLEDRAVKGFIRDHSAVTVDRPEWPEPRPNPECWFRELARGGVVPTAGETARNPRARSARLRVAERRAGL